MNTRKSLQDRLSSKDSTNLFLKELCKFRHLFDIYYQLQEYTNTKPFTFSAYEIGSDTTHELFFNVKYTYGSTLFYPNLLVNRQEEIYTRVEIDHNPYQLRVTDCPPNDV